MGLCPRRSRLRGLVSWFVLVRLIAPPARFTRDFTGHVRARAVAALLPHRRVVGARSVRSWRSMGLPLVTGREWVDCSQGPRSGRTRAPRFESAVSVSDPRARPRVRARARDGHDLVLSPRETLPTAPPHHPRTRLRVLSPQRCPRSQKHEAPTRTSRPPAERVSPIQASR
jgi:hypothetical protein